MKSWSVKQYINVIHTWTCTPADTHDHMSPEVFSCTWIPFTHQLSDTTSRHTKPQNSWSVQLHLTTIPTWTEWYNWQTQNHMSSDVFNCTWTPFPHGLSDTTGRHKTTWVLKCSTALEHHSHIDSVTQPADTCNNTVAHRAWFSKMLHARDSQKLYWFQMAHSDQEDLSPLFEGWGWVGGGGEGGWLIPVRHRTFAP